MNAMPAPDNSVLAANDAEHLGDGRASSTLPLLGFQGANASGHRILRKMSTVQLDGPRLPRNSSMGSRQKPNGRPLPALSALNSGPGGMPAAGAAELSNTSPPASPSRSAASRKNLVLLLPDSIPTAAAAAAPAAAAAAAAGGAPSSQPASRAADKLSARNRVPPLSISEARAGTPPPITSTATWSPTRSGLASTMPLFHPDHEFVPSSTALRSGITSTTGAAVPAATSTSVYSWEPETHKVLMEAAQANTDVSTFIKAVAGVLPDAALVPAADPGTLHWFRTQHAGATPTQRQDAVIVRIWFEEQMLELKRALGLEKQRPDPSSSSPSGLSPGTLTDDGQDSLLLVREPEGFVNATVLRHQEALLSKCCHELCGQVATVCMERGHLMHQLWQSMRHMLKLLLHDRDLARVWVRDSRASEAAAVENARATLARTEAEKNELLDINDILNRRLMGQKSDYEICKARCQELEKVMEKVTTSQPEVLQRSIDELRAALSAAERNSLSYQLRVEKANGQIGEQETELLSLSNKLDELTTDIECLTQQAQVRTPRPEQQQQPPWELLAPDEVALSQLALRRGCSPTDMHRLMLGVSATGANLLPWFHLAGSCRGLSVNGLDDPAVALAAAAAELEAVREATAQSSGGGRSTVPGSKRDDVKLGTAGRSGASFSSPTRPGAHGPPGVKRGESGNSGGNVLLGNTLLRSSMVRGAGDDWSPGALAGGTAGSSARSRPASSSSRAVQRNNKSVRQMNSMHEMFTWLKDLLTRQHIPTMRKCLPENVLEAVSQMTNHSIDVDSIASMLLGTISPEGTDVMPYQSLGGVLATKYSHTKIDIGGPITEALKVAAMSTVARVRHLEQQNKQLHRQAVKLKRAVREQRKQEQHRSLQEARTAQRKVTVHRVPRAISAFLIQKRAEVFVGLGTLPEVPQVLHCEGRVYNRCMEKGEAERLVNTVWQAKRDFERLNDTRIALADFLYVFFHRRYGTQKGIVEASYNLIYALGQHTYDPDCNLFLKIFLSEVEEAEREAQMSLKHMVIDALNKADEESNSRVTGWLQKHEIRACLRSLFKDKPAASLEDVYDSLDSDEPHEMVAYNRLFDDDDDLNQGVFAETIRTQHLNERLEFLQSIEDSVLDAVDKADVDQLTCTVMHNALKRSHPNLGEAALTDLMQRVFGGGWTAAVKKMPALGLEVAIRLLRRERASNFISLASALELAGPGMGPSNGKSHKTATTAGGAEVPEATVKTAKKGIMWGENTTSDAPGHATAGTGVYAKDSEDDMGDGRASARGSGSGDSGIEGYEAEDVESECGDEGVVGT